MHGMAAFFQSKHRAFTYHISGEKVNGKNYWLSGDEQDAIWYGPHQVGTGYGSGLGRLHFFSILWGPSLWVEIGLKRS